MVFINFIDSHSISNLIVAEIMKSVVVGIIIKKIEGVIKYLMVASSKDFGEFSGFYYPAGGHAKTGETERETLIREYREELEIEINPIKQIAVTPNDIKSEVTYWWICKTNDELKFDKNLKSHIADIRWFTKEEIKTEPKIWPATRKVFDEFVFKEN